MNEEVEILRTTGYVEVLDGRVVIKNNMSRELVLDGSVTYKKP